MGILENVFVGGVAVLVLALIVCVVVILFRKGSRDAFITWRPFAYVAAYASGIPLIRWGIDWLTDDPERAPFVLLLEFAAIIFAVFATIWFVGFFYGRWRRERRSGVLSRR